MDKKYEKAVSLIREAKHITVFTGAGISVESGIPPFRGEKGVWNKYDPEIFELNYFHKNPEESWGIIKKVFYNLYGKAEPNKAHEVLAEWEKRGIVNSIITQNIDGLHQKAGNKNVYEFHGTTRMLSCLECGKSYDIEKSNDLLEEIPPKCEDCGGVLKPDFVFFGEGIPKEAYNLSLKESKKADLFLVIGTTGEVMPASFIPQKASAAGTKIIEVNVK